MVDIRKIGWKIEHEHGALAPVCLPAVNGLSNTSGEELIGEWYTYLYLGLWLVLIYCILHLHGQLDTLGRLKNKIKIPRSKIRESDTLLWVLFGLLPL